MATTILTVPGISCEHCVRTVTEALTPVEGIERVSIDKPTKQVQVEYDQSRVDVEKMREVLAEGDYPVASVPSNRDVVTNGSVGTPLEQDPVCHMDVDPATAQHTKEYEGTTYSFCSRMCQQAFEGNPQQYLEGQQQPAR